MHVKIEVPRILKTNSHVKMHIAVCPMCKLQKRCGKKTIGEIYSLFFNV